MRSYLMPALAGLLLISGCASETATDPVATQLEQAPAELHRSPPGCPSPAAVRGQITALFPRGVRLAVGQAFFVVMQVAVERGNIDGAKQVMFAFLKYMLYEYQRGGLIGGASAATQAKMLTLTSSLYCYVGLPPLPAIDPDALGSDFGIGIVDENSPETVISTGMTNNQSAGVLVPAGAAPGTTVITITRLPDAPGPLNTHLDQYPAFYQYTASPDVAFDVDVTVGVCQVDNLTPYVTGHLRIAHNVGNGVELLPLVPATFLQNPGGTCDPFNLGLLNTPEGLLRYVLNGAGRAASYVLLPQVAQAGTVGQCCLGGSTKSFSPFGAVDTHFDWSATGWSWKQVATWSESYPADETITTAAGDATGYSGPVKGAFSKPTPLENTQCTAYRSESAEPPGGNASRIHSTIFDLKSVIAFRRDFILPGGATEGDIYFAVDNDFRVFVNGDEKTSSALFQLGASGSTDGIVSGFRRHDGCPDRGDFKLHLTGLSPVSNTIVVVALDRGGSTYFDASLTP